MAFSSREQMINLGAGRTMQDLQYELAMMSPEDLQRYAEMGIFNYYPGEKAIDPGQEDTPGYYNLDLGNGQNIAIRMGGDPSGGRNLVTNPYSSTGNRNMMKFLGLAGLGIGASLAGIGSPGAAAGTTGANAISDAGVIAGGSAGSGAGAAAGAAGVASQIPNAGDAPGPGDVPRVGQPPGLGNVPVPDAPNGSGGGLQDILNSVLGGSGLSADNLLDLFKLASGAFQSNRNDQTSDELRKLYAPYNAEAHGMMGRLRDTYDHPERYLQSPEYQAIQKTVAEQLGRRDAANGLNANSLGRQAKLQELAMGNLANYRTGLDRSMTGLAAIGTGQGAYNALESRNSTYAPLQSSIASIFS